MDHPFIDGVCLEYIADWLPVTNSCHFPPLSLPLLTLFLSLSLSLLFPSLSFPLPFPLSFPLPLPLSFSPRLSQILVVIEPLLIDEDYYARVEGREIISNLAKAAGLATMISTMRPDIDNIDEYVRNTTARWVVQPGGWGSQVGGAATLRKLHVSYFVVDRC